MFIVKHLDVFVYKLQNKYPCTDRQAQRKKQGMRGSSMSVSQACKNHMKYTQGQKQ